MADKSLEKFIERIIEIQNSQLNKRLDDKDLKSIAHDVGLSENEWQVIQKMFKDHLIRAKGFINYKNYDDAIEELEQAIILNPNHSETLYLKALAHKKRWNQSQNLKDKQLAIKNANYCIQLEPANKKAIELISTLRKPQPVYIPQKSQKEAGVIIAIVIIIVLFLVGFILYFTISDPVKVKPLEQIEVVTIEASSETNANYVPEISVVFTENSKSNGIKFDVESSEFKSYENSYSYALKGYLVLNQIEISKLKVKIELIDLKGNVSFSKDKIVLDYQEGFARSGDIIPFSYFKYEKNTEIPEFSEVVITPTYVEKQNAALNYEISKEKEFTWASERLRNYDIIIRERLQNINSYNTVGGIFSKLELEIENTGNLAISNLKFELQWHNKSGKIVDTKNLYITTSSKPKIKRGQKRVIVGTWSIKQIKEEELQGYTIIVANIE